MACLSGLRLLLPFRRRRLRIEVGGRVVALDDRCPVRRGLLWVSGWRGRQRWVRDRSTKTTTRASLLICSSDCRLIVPPFHRRPRILVRRHLPVGRRRMGTQTGEAAVGEVVRRSILLVAKPTRRIRSTGHPTRLILLLIETTHLRCPRWVSVGNLTYHHPLSSHVLLPLASLLSMNSRRKVLRHSVCRLRRLHDLQASHPRTSLSE